MDDLDDIEILFWEKVDKRGPDECWLWIGGANADGYGRQRVGSKLHFSHRISYALAHGPIPDGMLILHSCDTPACVNPAHLRPGTQQENLAERSARKRTASGERNGRAKIGPDQVRAIRELHAAGETNAALGRRFSLHPVTVGDIVRRKLWKDIA